jgi:uncharacterized protein
VRLTFLGGAEEVGRSCIMVTSEKAKILLDAGVKLEKDKNEFPQITEKEIKSTDGIFITHAHLDHCCYLPHLFSRGYTGKIFTTKPTMELLTIQIADYIRLSAPPDVTKDGLERMNKSFKVIEYKKPFVFKDMTIEFIPAGHIIGSALIQVTTKNKKLLYTGDINLTTTKLLDGADLKGLSADTLITESTYGGKDDIFPNEKELARQMIKSIKETMLAGGKVIIPSFGVGRAQEVLLFLDDFMNSGLLPKVPIYVDGVISKVLRIHRHNVIYCRKEIQSKILMSDYDPFKSDNFFMVDKKTMRNKIVESSEASIIVTTSGMLTGGPVVFYLKKLAGDSLNKMILVGYQAEGTAGRQLQDGIKEIDFHDSRLKVAMKVEVYHMSAHADRKQLEMIPKRISGLKNIYIVHGEKKKAEALKEAFTGKYNVVVPKIGESYNL